MRENAKNAKRVGRHARPGKRDVGAQGAPIDDRPKLPLLNKGTFRVLRAFAHSREPCFLAAST
jgi:hypothetical protein